MAAYIMLTQFTEQGVRKIKDSPKRGKAAIELGKKMGVNVSEMFWTLGPYDGVAFAEAPNDEAMTAYALKIASFGNIKTLTMRAFRGDECEAILKKQS